jgi:hypothetical protein
VVDAKILCHKDLQLCTVYHPSASNHLGSSFLDEGA